MHHRKQIKNICMVGIFSSILIVSSWLVLPLPIPITLQTFTLFFMACLLKRRQSVTVTAVYLTLGALGLPVFAGFQSGFGILTGPTGGFLIGFVPAVILLGTLYSRTDSIVLCYLISLMGLTVIYTFGCLWYAQIYHTNISGVLSACVLPFILPDIIKISVAIPLAKRLKPVIL